MRSAFSSLTGVVWYEYCSMGVGVNDLGMRTTVERVRQISSCIRLALDYHSYVLTFGVKYLTTVFVFGLCFNTV